MTRYSRKRINPKPHDIMWHTSKKDFCTYYWLTLKQWYDEIYKGNAIRVYWRKKLYHKDGQKYVWRTLWIKSEDILDHLHRKKRIDITKIDKNRWWWRWARRDVESSTLMHKICDEFSQKMKDKEHQFAIDLIKVIEESKGEKWPLSKMKRLVHDYIEWKMKKAIWLQSSDRSIQKWINEYERVKSRWAKGISLW